MADCARTMTSRLIGDMTLQGFGFEKGRPCGEFRCIILQDGRSFALHDGLREVFPRRCKVVQPAAVALHTTMDLLCDAPTTMVLTPDTANAQAFFRVPVATRPFAAGRPWLSRLTLYAARVQDEGGVFSSGPKLG